MVDTERLKRAYERGVDNGWITPDMTTPNMFRAMIKRGDHPKAPSAVMMFAILKVIDDLRRPSENVG